MSRKKLARPGLPKEIVDLNLPPEVFDIPEEYVVLPADRGGPLFQQALHDLTIRFKMAGSDHAEHDVEAVVQEIIAFLAKTVPLDSGKRPINGGELTAVFGLAIGTVAAHGFNQGLVPMPELESMADVFYVGMREGLPRGIQLLANWDAQAAKAGKK